MTLLNWTARSNPFDDAAGRGEAAVYSPDPNVVVWDGHISEFDLGGGGGLSSVAWSPSLGLFCAIGFAGSGVSYVLLSTNGRTWSDSGFAWDPDGSMLGVTWCEALGLFLIGGAGPGENLATSPDGMAWTLQTSASDGGEVLAVGCSEALSLLVAVGPAGLATSPDGAVWTLQTTPWDGTQQFSSTLTVAASPACIIVGGSPAFGPSVIRSTDGSTWTEEATPFDAPTPTTAALQPTFPTTDGTTVTDGGYTAVTDGELWQWAALSAPTLATFGEFTGSPVIIKSGQIWVGTGGGLTGAIEPAWATDPETDGGWTWSPLGSLGDAPAFSWTALTYLGPGGPQGLYVEPSPPNGFVYFYAQAVFGHVEAVCWAPAAAKFYAVGAQSGDGSDPTLVLAESADGATWTNVPAPIAPGGQHTWVLEGPGDRLYVGGYNALLDFTGRTSNSIGIVSSGDGGTTWRGEVNPLDPIAGVNAAAFSPPLDTIVTGGPSAVSSGTYALSLRGQPDGIFITVGAGGGSASSMLLSTDGATWLDRGVMNGMTEGQSAAASSELGLFAVGGIIPFLGAMLQISRDGAAWYDVTPAFWRTPVVDASTVSSIAWSAAQARFVCSNTYSFSGGGGPSYAVGTSPDGENWTGHDAGYDQAFGPDHFASVSQVAYSPPLDLWVITGSSPDGNISTSADGATWTHLPGSPTVQAVAWIAFLNLFVAFGLDGLYTSPDGTIWTAQSAPIFGTNAAVVDCLTKVVVGGGSGSGAQPTIIESIDTIDWTIDPSSPFDSAVLGLCFAAPLELVVALGVGS